MTATEPAMLVAADESAAVELLHELGCTDGLPVVVPTAERVERMVLATGLDGDLVLGPMGPNLGACRVDALAAAAVMAGCLADHAPIVVAAAQAIMDPAFDLTEMQATTHSTTPLIIVNGPAAQWCGVASGYGALGPGFRANATIGRALRLAMINIGGGRAGISDMALLGTPAKFTCCVAEDEAASPFAPLHSRRGFGAEQSTVTVIGTDGPHSVIGVTDGDDPTSADRLLTSLASAFANAATNNMVLRNGQAALALNPDHAQALADAGLDADDIAEAIAERAVMDGSELARTAAMGRLRPERSYRCFRSPEDLLVFVAGGGGLYSTAFPSWCAGPSANRAVTVAVDIGQACEIPGI